MSKAVDHDDDVDEGLIMIMMMMIIIIKCDWSIADNSLHLISRWRRGEKKKWHVAGFEF